MRIQLQRQNSKFHFEAANEDNIKVQIDGAPAIGGENLGARPMELLLMGLGGCASIDIGLILNKQKHVIDDMKIDIDAIRQKGAVPSLFEKINMEIHIKGDIPVKKVVRAVDLSLSKYCSVAKTLESTASIDYTLILNGEKV